MLILDLGLGSVFLAIGWILAWSKSAKGAAVVTFLLGILGGGTLFGAHLNSRDSIIPWDAASLGGLLLAMGLGTVLGLAVGTVWKQKSGGGVVIGMAQPKVGQQDRLEP